MKYFFCKVTTQYDGFEWTDRVLVEARNLQSAINKVNKFDCTHDNGIEVQYPVFADSLQEVSAKEALILKKYVLYI